MTTIEKIKDSLDLFLKQDGLTGSPEVVMSKDVYAEVLPYYDNHIGYKKYFDEELPEGYIRIVCRRGMFLSKALYRVKKQ